jgi:hypothetical protein
VSDLTTIDAIRKAISRARKRVGAEKSSRPPDRQDFYNAALYMLDMLDIELETATRNPREKPRDGPT